MPAELRHLRRRLDWLEAFASVLDSQLRAQGLRLELHLEECEPTTRNDRESRIRDLRATTGRAGSATRWDRGTRASTRSRDCCMSSRLARKPGPPNPPTWRDSSADLPKNAQREVHHHHRGDPVRSRQEARRDRGQARHPRPRPAKARQRCGIPPGRHGHGHGQGLARQGRRQADGHREDPGRAREGTRCRGNALGRDGRPPRQDGHPPRQRWATAWARSARSSTSSSAGSRPQSVVT
jgi:hypothetical protein